MNERTLDDALAHAANWRAYRDAGGLLTDWRDEADWRADLVLLSDEVLRLRQATHDHDEWLLEVGKGTNHE